MIIEHAKNEIILRLSADLSVDDLQDIVDYIEFKSISKKSKASQKDVNELMHKIKKGRWSKTKDKLGL